MSASLTFLEAMRLGIGDALEASRDVLVCGQLVKYGLGGLTTGLYESFPQQVITFPTCENLMNAAAMGLAMAGKRTIVVHERMDFLAVGMDPLVNHIPVWKRRAKLDMPLVMVAVVGKGKGQGPQHSKNLTPFFRAFEGWTVVEPDSPETARASVISSVFHGGPVMFVIHREFFDATGAFNVPRPQSIKLCGASKRHEQAFYGGSA